MFIQALHGRFTDIQVWTVQTTQDAELMDQETHVVVVTSYTNYVLEGRAMNIIECCSSYWLHKLCTRRQGYEYYRML
jgi:hypothetical protein